MAPPSTIDPRLGQFKMVQQRKKVSLGFQNPVNLAYVDPEYIERVYPAEKKVDVKTMRALELESNKIDAQRVTPLGILEEKEKKSMQQIQMGLAYTDYGALAHQQAGSNQLMMVSNEVMRNEQAQAQAANNVDVNGSSNTSKGGVDLIKASQVQAKKATTSLKQQQQQAKQLKHPTQLRQQSGSVKTNQTQKKPVKLQVTKERPSLFEVMTNSIVGRPVRPMQTPPQQLKQMPPQVQKQMPPQHLKKMPPRHLKQMPPQQQKPQVYGPQQKPTITPATTPATTSASKPAFKPASKPGFNPASKRVQFKDVSSYGHVDFDKLKALREKQFQTASRLSANA